MPTEEEREVLRAQECIQRDEYEDIAKAAQRDSQDGQILLEALQQKRRELLLKTSFTGTAAERLLKLHLTVRESDEDIAQTRLLIHNAEKTVEEIRKKLYGG